MCLRKKIFVSQQPPRTQVEVIRIRLNSGLAGCDIIFVFLFFVLIVCLRDVNTVVCCCCRWDEANVWLDATEKTRHDPFGALALLAPHGY